MSYVQAFIDEVKSWVGTPYKMRMSHCSKGGGANCAEFVQYALQASLPPEIVPPRKFDHVKLLRTRENVVLPYMLGFCREVSIEELRLGDIVVLAYADIPVQPAVYVGNNEFIYCTRDMGVHKEQLPRNFRERIATVLRPYIFEEEELQT